MPSTLRLHIPGDDPRGEPVASRREAFDLAIHAAGADRFELTYWRAGPRAGERRETYTRIAGRWYGRSGTDGRLIRVEHAGPNAGRIMRHPRTNATIHPTREELAEELARMGYSASADELDPERSN